MPENFLVHIKQRLKPQWVTAFYSSIIIGFLVHLFVFTNRLMNHDSLHNIYNTQAKVKSGRFFLGPSSGLSTFFDLPWVIGILSIFFLALVVICIVELFELRKTLSIIIVSGIVVAFPSVTSTFSYMFTADGYMFGTFVAILAVLMTKKYKFGYLYGALLLCVSIGVYQANLSVALTFIILWLLREILCLGLDNKKLLTYVVKFGAMVVLGLGIYYIAFKLYRETLSGYITSYQGLDKVGSLPLESIPGRIIQIKDQLIEFFFRGFFTYHEINLFEILNVFIFITIFVVTAGLILRNKIYKNLVQMIAILILIISLPFAYYIVYFISPDAFYHMLMVFSLTSVYMYLILIYDTIDTRSTNSFTVITSWISVTILSLSIFNFGLIANITYFNMEMRFEKSTALVNRVLDRIEQLDNYEEIEKIAVVGKVSMYSELSSEIIPTNVPSMIGALGETFLAEPYHYKAMLENFFGLSLEVTNEKELEKIKQSKDFKEMNIWPAESSVKEIDGTVVIKFKEE